MIPLCLPLQMSETFTFDVSYGTSFQDLERLREKMLEFLKTERRDYQTNFDVRVVGKPCPSKMLFISLADLTRHKIFPVRLR